MTIKTNIKNWKQLSTKMIKKILQFFNTAPKVKSDKVLQIEKDGRINELLDAIEKEIQGLPQTGEIKVIRIGSIFYNNQNKQT